MELAPRRLMSKRLLRIVAVAIFAATAGIVFISIHSYFSRWSENPFKLALDRLKIVPPPPLIVPAPVAPGGLLGDQHDDDDGIAESGAAADHDENSGVIQGVTDAVFTPDDADGDAVSGEQLTDPIVAIVVAKTVDQDTDWIAAYFPQWWAYIYSVDDPTAEHQAANRGREGSAYLTYILENYGDDPSGADNSLADYVVFHHPDRYQWHNDDPDTDAVRVLQTFNFGTADQDGFVNLRCDWAFGCDDEEPREPTTIWDEDLGGIQWLTLFGRALAELRPYERGPTPYYPKVVRSPCCAQFVVSKKRILTVPKKKYEQYRSFLYDWHFSKAIPEFQGDMILGQNVSSADSEGAISGGLMEYMWHMIFGRPAVDCMPMHDCYCRNFGMCDGNWNDEVVYYG